MRNGSSFAIESSLFFSSGLSSQCSKFFLSTFHQTWKIHSISCSHFVFLRLIFVCKWKKLSVRNVFTMSIYSISFHFSFASNITKDEISRPSTSQADIHTHTHTFIQNMISFHFFFCNHNGHAMLSLLNNMCVFIFANRRKKEKKHPEMCYPADMMNTGE